MTVVIDIDGTICTQEEDYSDAQPFHERIESYNSIKRGGAKVIYWTARGSTTGINWRAETEKQLKDWGVEYDELWMGKPYYDVFIDDKSVNPGGIK